ncbi:MAG: glycosyltransferase family 4 protein [Candidatus Aureabacteria bacterium]|nr:glycosyltransferase family 4 protein [Candidatus Auribacterota bacterium]
MKVLFAVSRLEKPSSRLRVLQYLPFLKEAAFECRVIELRKSLLKRAWFLYLAFSSDIVFIQKKLLTPVEVIILHLSRAKKVFDIDDALVYREKGRDCVKDKKAERKLQFLVKRCDLVLAGNDYLKEMVKRGNGSVEVFPTPCPRTACGPVKEKKEKKHLVWIGSKSTLKYLDSLGPVFHELSRMNPELRLIIISDSFPDEILIPTEEIPWSERSEFESVSKGAIGLMPLFDNDWCKGKCGYKIIQYMACGLPSVASPVGFNSHLIQDGVNGFLAKSDEEWIEKITRLLSDEKLYRSLSLKARETFERDYTLEGNAEKLVAFLKNLF